MSGGFRLLDVTHASGQRYHALLDICRGRLLMVMGLVLIGFMAISVRLLVIVVEGQTAVTAQKENNSLTGSQMRADIVDRNGHILARTIHVKSLNADVPIMRKAKVDLELAAEKIAFLFPGIDPVSLHEKFKTRDHFPLRDRLTPEQVWQVRKLGIPGIFTLERETRIYPYDSLFAHIVGFVDHDNEGQNGVELSFNSLLQRKASALHLSLDLNMQHILYSELQKSFTAHQAIRACGIIMDARNFEIRAMVSLPDYDPHHPREITKDKYFNCTTQGSYELGSVFKIITTAMALDSGVANLETLYDTTRSLDLGKQKISDTKLSSYPLNLRQVFVRSSNVGAALVAREVGAERQEMFLRQFGLLKPSLIELEGKAHPKLTEGGRNISTLTIGFGHGIAVSPLNLIASVTGLVNDGFFYPPTLLYSATAPRGGKQIVRPTTSEKLRQLMYLSVREGTGKAARVSGYAVGGKTGTAEKPVKTEKGWEYSSKDVISSFMAAFPIHNPDYVIYVMLDEPKGLDGTSEKNSASYVAAPLAKRIIEALIPVAGIPPVDEESKGFRQVMGFDPAPLDGQYVENGA